jgi:adenylate kinase
MTQAQKTAKAKFKQAIAYRQKTGVSLKEAFAHIYGKKVGAVKKKSAPKKKAAKKVVKKKVAKKVVSKKVAKKKITRVDYDKRFQAEKPGKRKSASGNTYYEYRENRTDKGRLLGVGYTLDKFNRLKK